MYFIITIDTEGDNLWGIKQCRDGKCKVDNKNGAYIQRFQELCEKYSLIPTYFVNFEMTESRAFTDMAKFALKNSKCEIGMHMHAWNSPPIYVLQTVGRRKNISYGKPYAGEYPDDILIKKMDYLNERLENLFDTKIKSHRGGRWYFDERILRWMIKNKYCVDATITPGISWKNNYGNKSEGCDYTSAQMKAYEISIKDVLKEGKSGVFEIPPTILSKKWRDIKKIENVTELKRELQMTYWLRPNGNNLKDMLHVLEMAEDRKMDYVEFMIHSSELMPGGSPTFRTTKSIESLYYDLEILFAFAGKYYRGIGITEYAKKKYKR